MRRLPGGRRYVAAARTWLWIGLLGWLSACAGAPAAPLPTQMPVAVLPTETVTAVPSPTPSATPTVAPTPTSTITPSATPAPPPTATPTAVPVPDFRVAGEIDPPFFAQPPGSVACDGHGVLFRSQYASGYGGPLRTYAAYLPPCYGQQGRRYPVLYLFHGSIQTETHWVELGLVDLLDQGIAAGRYPPMIVIMPFNGELGNKTSGGARSIEGITVDALIPAIDATYCTWAARAGRGIGGISRGGYWALMIAFRQPELFTAVSGHSSHLRYETDKAEYNPLSTYATADLAHMRIWLDWGEKDFLYFGQKTLHESLLEAEIPHEAHVNSGGHNVWYWLEHIEAYVDWHAASWPLDPAAYPPCG